MLLAAAVVVLNGRPRRAAAAGHLRRRWWSALDLVLRHTVFGRWMYAVGGNAEAARRAGINVTADPDPRVRRRRRRWPPSAASSPPAGSPRSTRAPAAATSCYGDRRGGHRRHVACSAAAAAPYAALLGILVIQSITNGMLLLNVDSSVRFMVTAARARASPWPSTRSPAGAAGQSTVSAGPRHRLRRHQGRARRPPTSEAPAPHADSRPALEDAERRGAPSRCVRAILDAARTCSAAPVAVGVSHVRGRARRPDPARAQRARLGGPGAARDAAGRSSATRPSSSTTTSTPPPPPSCAGVRCAASTSASTSTWAPASAAALVVGGRVVPGAHGAAGEIGYLLDTTPSPASPTVTRRWRRSCPAWRWPAGRGAAGPARRRRRTVRPRGRNPASPLLDEAVETLAATVANLCVALDPERVVIGGGMMGAAGRILPRIAAALRRAVPFPPALAKAAGSSTTPRCSARSPSPTTRRRPTPSRRADRIGDRLGGKQSGRRPPRVDLRSRFRRPRGGRLP